MSNKAEQTVGLECLLFFSDAVFAIAITLLALELKVPARASFSDNMQLGDELVTILPAFVGFVFSFLLIGQTWIEHHRIGKMLQSEDRGLLWWGLGLLLCVAVMPFTTNLVSEYFDNSLAVVIYAAAFGCLGFCKVGFWRHARKAGLVQGSATELHDIDRRVWAAPLVAAVVVALAAVDIPFAYVSFS